MIFGICGLIGSGKGTVGDRLVEHYGFEKLAFANPLKDAVSIIFGWERALLEGDTKESREFREKVDTFWSTRCGRTITPRLVLQLVGTESFRDVISPDVWVSSLEKKLDLNPNKDYVVTDVRFPNEIGMLRSRRAKIVRVVRGELPEWYEDALSDNTNGTTAMRVLYPEVHISEWAWIGTPMDVTIYNDYDLDTLYQTVEALVNPNNYQYA